jgi:glycosyltransferase involved in cell wall biosynthesis
MSDAVKYSQADVFVSVVMPIYNQATFVRMAISSLLCQTYQN